MGKRIVDLPEMTIAPEADDYFVVEDLSASSAKRIKAKFVLRRTSASYNTATVNLTASMADTIVCGSSVTDVNLPDPASCPGRVVTLVADSTVVGGGFAFNIHAAIGSTVMGEGQVDVGPTSSTGVRGATFHAIGTNWECVAVVLTLV
jgi:hypothetical protein